MEILIFGVILVGLMVYASTRIKRSAAQAFEPESIDEESFSLSKPKGFLCVLNGDPSLNFESYLKEMGSGDASRIRSARAELRIFNDRRLKDDVDKLKKDIDVSNEIAEVIDGKKYLILDGRSKEKEIAYRESYKLIEDKGRLFEFKVKVLESAAAEVSEGADAMLGSFTIR